MITRRYMCWDLMFTIHWVWVNLYFLVFSLLILQNPWHIVYWGLKITNKTWNGSEKKIIGYDPFTKRILYFYFFFPHSVSNIATSYLLHLLLPDWWPPTHINWNPQHEDNALHDLKNNTAKNFNCKGKTVIIIEIHEKKWWTTWMTHHLHHRLHEAWQIKLSVIHQTFQQ